MKFIKRLVIQYILNFIFGLILGIIPLINPYIFMSYIFDLMVFLFYALLTINLVFSILYIIILFKYDNYEKDFCYSLTKFSVLCRLCDYYLECKEKEKEK